MLGTIAEGTCSEMQVMRAVGCVVGKKFETLTVCHRVGNCTGSPNRSKPPSACAALDLSTLTPGVEGAGSVARVSSGSQWLGRCGSSDKPGASGVRVVTGQPWMRQGLKMVRTVSTQSAAPECWSPVHSRNKCKTCPVGRFRSHSSHFIKKLASQADAFMEGSHLMDMIVYDEDLRGHHHRPWQAWDTKTLLRHRTIRSAGRGSDLYLATAHATATIVHPNFRLSSSWPICNNGTVVGKDGSTPEALELRRHTDLVRTARQ